MFRTLRLTLCWISVLTSIAFAAPPTSIDLHSGWKFRALEASSDHPGMDQWRDAEVPGLVQMDLLRNKQIPDPFYRDNEKSLQWIGLTDWEYRTEFNVDAATLAAHHSSARGEAQAMTRIPNTASPATLETRRLSNRILISPHLC